MKSLEHDVAESYGYKLDQELGAANILSFADNTILVGKGK